MQSSIKNTSACPIKDLLYLINQDHIEQLRSALLELINKFQPGGEIFLYEQGYSIYESNKNNFIPKLLAHHPKNSKVKHADKVVRFTESTQANKFSDFTFAPTDDYVQVFTVESEHSNPGLLITVNKEMINEDYIYTLISFYNQQVYLLRNKDTDSLTGLYNRHSFDSTLKKYYDTLDLHNRSNDVKSSNYFAMLDIDFFKKINDEYGHVYGDEVLLLIANSMKKTFRDADILFRYGGEEFAVLLKDVTEEQAENILNRFRQNIEELNFPFDHKVTISIGFCVFNNASHLSTIIDNADKALYYSKEHGRNKVSNFDFLLRENKIEKTPDAQNDIELF